MTAQEFTSELDRIEPFLVGFSIKLTSDGDKAKDLMQETFYKAFKNRDKFTAGTNFQGWILRIMYNAFVNDYRKKKNRNKIVRELDNFSFIVSTEPSENNAYSSLQMEEINTIIDSLKGDFKKPFRLLLQGYQYNEISEILDTPIGTVKSRIFFARKKLQTILQKNYNIENLIAA